VDRAALEGELTPARGPPSPSPGGSSPFSPAGSLAQPRPSQLTPN